MSGAEANQLMTYAERIAAIHALLEIPADYAAGRGLALSSEATDAELEAVARTSDGREIRLLREAAAAWRTMERVALADQVTLVPISGFRSVDRQVELVRRKLDAGVSIDAALRVLAAPGFSEHHTGRALDIASPGQPPLEENFETTKEFHWLARRAGEFGFHLSFPKGNAAGIAYEPWHWCWRNSSV